MLLKKLYIPIGLCLVLLLAIGFLALRSDVVDEPVKIYKVVEPAEQSETQTATANSDTLQGERFHADGNPFHTEQQPTAQVSKNQRTEGNLEASEHIALGGEIAAETPQPPSEEQLAEMRYDIAAAKYYKAMQEYYKKDQALSEEFDLLSAESDELYKAMQVDPKTLSREEGLELLDRVEAHRKKSDEFWKRKDALLSKRPIAPTPPERSK